MKTKKNESDVNEFLSAVEPEEKRKDSLVLLKMMGGVTGDAAAMWGGNIVGFGKYSYKYASGHSGEWFLTGFSPRKQNITVYIMSGFDRYQELMAKLGKHKTGKSCLYLNRLSDVDVVVLRQLVSESVSAMRATDSA